MIPLLFMLVGAWMLIAWIAYDMGYDRGWWDGRYPARSGSGDAGR